MAESCPQTKMVLGGYSQGAAVVDILTATGRPILGFTSPLPETVADHIAAVAVVGNPSNRIGDPVALSPLYGSKAVDLCHGADPVCSTGDDIPAQSSYVEAGMTTQAAQFVAGSSQECTDYPASSRQQLIAERAPWAQSCFAATMSTMLARHPNSKPLLARGSPVWLHRFLQSAAHAGDDDDR